MPRTRASDGGVFKRPSIRPDNQRVHLDNRAGRAAAMTRRGRGSEPRADLAGRLAAPFLAILQRTAVVAAGLIALTLGLAWSLSRFAGGANELPPHGFYVPILFAAVRFGLRGAIPTALVASILSGPLLPADVASSAAQSSAEWLTRGTFFLIIGICMAGLTQAAVTRERAFIDRAGAERELAEALSGHQFRLVYQPVVTMDGATVVGVEALIRWQHPRRGLLAPDDFIELAEDSGIIVEMGRWVLTEACHQAARWRTEQLTGVEDYCIAVNISARELSEPSLVEAIRDVLTASGLPPHWLHLEVTETSLITDLDASERHLRAIKALGVKLVVDDFGVGYGSMTYLNRFPIDIVKIDRSFVASIADTGESRGVAGGIVLLARSLGMRTVAEGVETPAQAAALRDLECDHAQGWLFGRPASPDAIGARIDRRDGSSDASDPRSADVVDGRL